MSADPFAAHGLRQTVLAAWTAQPARFREDANAEEDQARGYYRDRVVIELAQNAADAAARAGAPGRLLLRRVETATGPLLLAANTGAPLDAAGVASLASLRASAKRDVGAPTVGRFGVGFAAVRSVADVVTVASATGAVHFSRDATADVLAEPELLDAADGDLAAEVRRRTGSLPALRLPFAGPAADHRRVVDELLAQGWDTVVVLSLRDDAADEQVRAQLDAVGDPLLLALPALTSVHLESGGETRVAAGVADRWVVATRSGHLPADLLAGRPVEERERTGWQVTWAVPRGRTGGPEPRGVVHAPTPTDEPCTIPALLLATFPLDPARRHVAPGPVTDVLVQHAGRAWTDLLVACRDERSGEPSSASAGPAASAATASAAPDPLDLLPGGLPAGALDAALREAVLDATRSVALFAPAGGGPLLPATEAVVLDGPVGQDTTALAALGASYPQLVALAPHHRHLPRLLGMTATDLADVVEGLPDAGPERLTEICSAFVGADRTALEALATLPVPLVDGRTVRGARGTVILEVDLGDDVLQELGAWGVRIVHPGAAHPLLERLGATRTDAAALLHHPLLRERVLAGDDDDTDPMAVSHVLLRLVAAATGPVAPEGWWGEVLLPTAEDELVPARGLVLPGSPAADWFDPDVLAPVAADEVERWGAALVDVGVRDGLTVVRLSGGPDDALVTETLDGWAEYLEEQGLDAVPDEGLELVAVADLDAVRPEAWPQVLAALGAGETRRAVIERVRVPGGHPRPTAVPYTAWWLRRRSGLGLGRPFALPGTGAPVHGLGALLAPAPAVVAHLDVELQRALGGLADPQDLDPDDWLDLLEGLPPTGEPVELDLAVAVWRGLARLVDRHEQLTLDPADLPALVGPGAHEVRVTPLDEVAVVPPMWAQHAGVRPALVVPPGTVEALAAALDADLAEDRQAGEVTSSGHRSPTPDAVLRVFGAAPGTWHEHDDLRVDGVPVDWWVEGGVVHASTTGGLARGIAYRVGWQHRDRIERLLTDPDALDEVLLDRSGDLVDPADGSLPA